MFDLKPWLKIKDIELTSRLLIGTEQYTTAEMIKEVTIASGSELMIATINPRDRSSGVAIADVARAFERENYKYVPVSTTSFVQSGKDAVDTARKLRELFDIRFVKLDVRNDPKQRWANNFEVVEAAKILLSEGFDVMPMITPDPYAAVMLEDLGCCALRLSAGELGTGVGIYNFKAMENVKKSVGIPCIGETGIINVTEVCQLFDIGMDAVLVNSAIAQAHDPIKMATAMKLAVESALHQNEALRALV
ncbi:thiamine biosynthesis protein ThiG [Aeromonas salmonicida]|uniref:thiazole synthase n=1 Tax=Aeromonas salmonicida TaxID=645 RepID=A0AAX1PDY5_AERSA|nr:thiamine biosynthesis protein ThiG [Aeromonas salmonicida]RAI99676.1 thiazole synthase [Aeromonas salmonicida]